MVTKKKTGENKTEELKDNSNKNVQISKDRLTDISKENLNRILSIFPRADTLSSVVLAIDISMLGVLASQTPSLQNINRLQIITAVSFILFVSLSLYHLYKCAFPRLECEEKSLIYFREIGDLKQLEFANKFIEQTESDYLNDLIKQVWRNSEILKLKFQHLKNAFRFLVLALVPWTISLLIFASENKTSFLTK